MSWLLPLGAVVLAGGLVEPVLLDVSTWAEARGLFLRLGWLCCGAMSLRTYSALVRSPERAVLDAHPADPPRLLQYLVVRCAWEGLFLLVGALFLTWPILAAGHHSTWCAGAMTVLVGWATGLFVGFPVHLGSVWVAESPRLSGVLEVLRGANPRLQAALIYAPGVVLALGGGATWVAAQSGGALLKGELGAFGLILPVAICGVAWGLTPWLARRWYVRTSLLLAEIDARYAGLEDAEEARWVYLQWMLRWLPQSARPHLLRELRHGWRGQRGWITGAWGMGVLAALAAWSEAPDAGGKALVVSSAGAVVAAVVGLRLARADPAWLDDWLDVPRRVILCARGGVLACWLQALVLPPVLALVLRQGWEPGSILFLELEGLVLVLSVLGAVCGKIGWVAYAPLALIAWAGVVSQVSG